MGSATYAFLSMPQTTSKTPLRTRGQSKAAVRRSWGIRSADRMMGPATSWGKKATYRAVSITDREARTWPRYTSTV